MRGKNCSGSRRLEALKKQAQEEADALAERLKAAVKDDKDAKNAKQAQEQAAAIAKLLGLAVGEDINGGAAKGGSGGGGCSQGQDRR